MRKRLGHAATGQSEFKLLLSIEESAQILSLGRNTIYDLVLRGRLGSIKIGRLRRVPVEAPYEFVNQQMQQVQQAGGK